MNAMVVARSARTPLSEWIYQVNGSEIGDLHLGADAFPVRAFARPGGTSKVQGGNATGSKLRVHAQAMAWRDRQSDLAARVAARCVCAAHPAETEVKRDVRSDALHDAPSSLAGGTATGQRRDLTGCEPAATLLHSRASSQRLAHCTERRSSAHSGSSLAG